MTTIDLQFTSTQGCFILFLVADRPVEGRCIGAASPKRFKSIGSYKKHFAWHGTAGSGHYTGHACGNLSYRCRHVVRSSTIGNSLRLCRYVSYRELRGVYDILSSMFIVDNGSIQEWSGHVKSEGKSKRLAYHSPERRGPETKSSRATREDDYVYWSDVGACLQVSVQVSMIVVVFCNREFLFTAVDSCFLTRTLYRPVAP